MISQLNWFVIPSDAGVYLSHCGQLSNIEINFKKLHLVSHSYIQPIASSAALAPLGFRLLRRAAFPFIRANDNCWNRCLVVVDSSSPV